MTKLERIDQDLVKARTRAAEAQAKVKELEAQRTEEENNLIVQIVRKTKLTHHQLADFLERNRAYLTNPAKQPAVPLSNDHGADTQSDDPS